MSNPDERSYRVVLLPKQIVAARSLSLREAQAWVQAYNQVLRDARRQAVIAEEVNATETAVERAA
jgi:phage protein D